MVWRERDPTSRALGQSSGSWGGGHNSSWDTRPNPASVWWPGGQQLQERAPGPERSQQSTGAPRAVLMSCSEPELQQQGCPSLQVLLHPNSTSCTTQLTCPTPSQPTDSTSFQSAGPPPSNPHFLHHPNLHIQHHLNLLILLHPTHTIPTYRSFSI